MSEIEDFARYDLPDADQYSIELFKAMDQRFRAGPSPIDGSYRLTHGQELTFWQLARYGAGYTVARSIGYYAVEEAQKTVLPITSTGISVNYAGTPHEHYTYMASDDIYYPGKGIIEWIASLY